MIKLIIFDLDGVLVSSIEMHARALNNAVKEVGIQYIPTDNLLDEFGGLSMFQKLKILTREKGLPIEKYNQILARKQELMILDIENNIFPNMRLIQLFKYLKKNDLIVYVASNSRKDTIKQFLIRLKLMKYINGLMSSEDIKSPKPDPEIYLKIMATTNIAAEETLIIEDSLMGIRAAKASGGYTWTVKAPIEITRQNIKKIIEEKKNGQ